jgi:hypothetical protein
MTEISELENTGVTSHFGILLKTEETLLKDTKFAVLWEKKVTSFGDLFFRQELESSIQQVRI